MVPSRCSVNASTGRREDTAAGTCVWGDRTSRFSRPNRGRNEAEDSFYSDLVLCICGDRHNGRAPTSGGYACPRVSDCRLLALAHRNSALRNRCLVWITPRDCRRRARPADSTSRFHASRVFYPATNQKRQDQSFRFFIFDLKSLIVSCLRGYSSARESSSNFAETASRSNTVIIPTNRSFLVTRRHPMRFVRIILIASRVGVSGVTVIGFFFMII